MTTKLTDAELSASIADAPALSDNSAALVTSAWVKALLAQGTVAGNGWLQIGPIMLQWGRANSLGNNTPTTVSFNTAFPAGAFVVVANDCSSFATAGNPRTMGCTILSTTQFTIEASGSGAAAFWIAIGH